MQSPNTNFERLVVLVDPSTPDGELGADLAQSLIAPDGRFHVAVALSSTSAWAFEAFADSERVSVNQAVGSYVTRVSDRLGRDRTTATFLSGEDIVFEVSALVQEVGANAVVVPATLAAQVLATKRSWAALPFPVIVAPGARAA